jgi:RNA polymerase sigma-70 factor, ECF subfamily
MELNNNNVFRLLKRIAAQDEGAFREIHDAFARPLYLFALNRLRDADKAQEIVADTLHEIWKHPDRFRGEARFGTWLIGIARNKILHMWRDAESQHEDLDDAAPLLVSSEPDGFAAFAENERRQGVRACMEQLPDEQRDCLHLVFYEGMTLAEVASVQSVPENTVQTRLFHARRKIRDCLKRLLAKEGVHG